MPTACSFIDIDQVRTVSVQVKYDHRQRYTVPQMKTPEQQRDELEQWANKKGYKFSWAGASNSTSSVYARIDKITEWDEEYGATEEKHVRIRFADHGNSHGAEPFDDMFIDVWPGGWTMQQAKEDIVLWMEDAIQPGKIKSCVA